jgi:uncharacterized protein (TIGR02453 family)
MADRKPPKPVLLTAFNGFTPKAFTFFEELTNNQDRDWFQANKSVYETAVLGPLNAFVAELTMELKKRGLPLQGDPTKAVFRIYRDVRFSKDKNPYKTHAGAVLTRDGDKTSPGLLYLHVAPTGCFTAAGFYRPDAPLLKQIRERIASEPAEFRKALDEMRGWGYKLEVDGDALKKTPRGFETVDDPVAQEVLKYHSWIVRMNLTKRAMAKRTLVQEVADFAEAAVPLLRFGWEAMARE